MPAIFEVYKNGKGEYMVYAVQINDTQCIGEHTCKLENANTTAFYKVKAITMGGRIFYGIYNSITKSWLNTK